MNWSRMRRRASPAQRCTEPLRARAARAPDRPAQDRAQVTPPVTPLVTVSGADGRAARAAAPAAAPFAAVVLGAATIACAALLLGLGLAGCEDEGGATTTTQANTAVTFSDMGAADPALPAALSASGYGLLTEDQSGRFRPADPVSRAEFAMLVAEVLGLESAAPASPTFVDVPQWHPAYGAVESLATYFPDSAGGTADAAGKTFRPDEAVGAAEAVQTLTAALQKEAPDRATALSAALAGVAGGDAPLTRAEAARLLVALVKAAQPPPGDALRPVGVN